MEEISKIVQNGFKGVFTGTSKIASLIVLNHCLKNSEDVLEIIKNIPSTLVYKTIDHSRCYEHFIVLRKWIEEHVNTKEQGEYFVLNLGGLPIYTEKSSNSKIYYIPKLHQQIIDKVILDRTHNKLIIKYIRTTTKSSVSQSIPKLSSNFISFNNLKIIECIKNYVAIENVICQNKILGLIVEDPGNSDYKLLYNGINQLDEVSTVQVMRCPGILCGSDEYSTVISTLPQIIATTATVVIFEDVDITIDRWNNKSQEFFDLLKEKIFLDILSVLELRVSSPTVVIFHVRNVEYFRDFFGDKFYLFRFEKYSRIIISECLRYYNNIFTKFECLNKLYYSSLDTILLNLSDDVIISYQQLILLLFREFFNYPRIIDILNSNFCSTKLQVNLLVNSRVNSRVNSTQFCSSICIPKVRCVQCEDGAIREDLFHLGIKKCFKCAVVDQCCICLTSGEFKYMIENKAYLCQECAEKVMDTPNIIITYHTTCPFMKDTGVCKIKLQNQVRSNLPIVDMCKKCNKKWCSKCHEQLDMTNCYVRPNKLKVCYKCTVKGDIKYQQVLVDHVKGICCKCKCKCKLTSRIGHVLCTTCAKKRNFNHCFYCGLKGNDGSIEGFTACRKCIQNAPKEYSKSLTTFSSCRNCKGKYMQFTEEGYTQNNCRDCKRTICDVCNTLLGETDYFDITINTFVHKKCINMCPLNIQEKFKNLKNDGVKCIQCARSLTEKYYEGIGIKICTYCSSFNEHLGCIRCLRISSEVELYRFTFIDEDMRCESPHVCIDCMNWINHNFHKIYTFRSTTPCKGCNIKTFEIEVIDGKIMFSNICIQDKCVKNKCFKCGDKNPTYEAPSINRLVCEGCKYSCQDMVHQSELVHVIKT